MYVCLARELKILVQHMPGNLWPGAAGTGAAREIFSIEEVKSSVSDQIRSNIAAPSTPAGMSRRLDF